MDDEPLVLKAPANRTLGVIEVQCHACQHVNQFPGFDAVIVFVCEQCGQPIEVIEPVQ